MPKQHIAFALFLSALLISGCSNIRLNPAYFPGTAETASPAGLRVTTSQEGAWVGLVRAEEMDSGDCAPIPYKDNTYRPRVLRWKSTPARFTADEFERAACWIIVAYPPDERPESNYVSFMSLPNTRLVVGGNDLVPESHHFTF